MPVEAKITAGLRVTSTLGLRPSVRAQVGSLNSGPDLAATVSRAALERYTGASLVLGLRIVLGGVDVTNDLSGSLTWRESLDDPVREARFTLLGRPYSPTVTTTTWTRTPVQIYTLQGPPGDVTEVLELDGLVDTCTANTQGNVQITAGDYGLAYAQGEVCYELEPLRGLSRGAIARNAAASAGVLLTNIPAGATYDKPVQADGEGLFAFLQPFGEPEGWHWRTLNDHTLQAYTARLRHPPEAPDHVWQLCDLYDHVEITPPEGVASRWVVRGQGAVRVSEAGEVTEIRETEVIAPYAIKRAQARQESTGSIVQTPTTETVTDEVISRVIDQVTKRAGKLIRQVTRQLGWYNPAHAKLTTSSIGTQSPEGYYYLTSRIDSEDRYVVWSAQRFLEIGRREETWQYDADGNLIERRIKTYSYHRRRAGVRTASSPTINVIGTLVGDDDLSYKDRGAGAIETYGLSEEQITRYQYDSVNGDARVEDQEVYTYHSPQVAVDPTFTGHYVLSDGTGQADIVANWSSTTQQIRTNITDSSGRLLGVSDVRLGYQVTEIAAGLYDYGTFRANRKQARFAVLSHSNQAYRVESDDLYVEIEYIPGHPAKETRRQGRPPLPRYLTSPWVELTQQPVEAIHSDSVLESYFGFRRQVLQHDHVQSVSEAQAILDQLVDRALSHRFRVRRPDHPARPGDTIRLIDIDRGVDHRALVIDVQRERSLSPPLGVATYQLVAPLREAAA